MEKDSVYKSAGKGFYICYYASALFPQYFMLLVAFTSENLEKTGLPNLNILMTKKKFVGIIILCATGLSIVCLVLLWWDIKTIENDCGFGGLYSHKLVKISYRKNVGTGQFFNDIIIPIIISLPCTNLPFTSLLLLGVVQVATALFYLRSSDVFPNLSLYFIKYDVYKTKPDITNKNIDNSIKYVLVKQNSNNKLLSCKSYKSHKVVPFIPRSNKSKFAIYIRKDDCYGR